MKRTTIALIAAAIVAAMIAPALAGGPDFSSDKKIAQFWQERATVGGGDAGGGGN